MFKITGTRSINTCAHTREDSGNTRGYAYSDRGSICATGGNACSNHGCSRSYTILASSDCKSGIDGTSHATCVG